jgi:zinc protease
MTLTLSGSTVMKRCIVILLLLASMPALAQKIRVPAVSRHTLENGLTVLLMEYRKVPVVHYRMVLRGGSAQDPEGLEGAAGMTASLMREGTETRSAIDIARAIDFIGGSLSVNAGLDYSAAVAEALAKDADTCLALFADVILHPVFPDEELDRERKQWLAALDAVKEEPRSLTSLVFNRVVYGSHPYGRQRGGTRQSLEDLSRKDLETFYRRIFIPRNAILVVAGDFKSPDMLAKIQQAFSGWTGESPDTTALPAPAFIQGRQVVLIDKPDATQAQIRLGNIGIDIRNPDYFPVMVANTIFGEGFTSRLVEELRVKRSLTYGAGSGFATGLSGGSFSIGTFTKNETLGEAIDVILAELQKFRKSGATADELAKAKNYMAGEFARSLQSPGAIASRLTDIEIYGFPQDYLTRYIERLRAVSGDDVRKAAQKHFQHDDLVLVLLAPAPQVRGTAEKYGPTTVLPLEEAVK